MQPILFAIYLIVLASAAIPTNSEESQSPYQVSIRYKTQLHDHCNGVILTENWILTAGSCVAYDIKYLDIYSGIGNPKTISDKYSVQSKILHPQYKRDQLVNNIALLMTRRKIIFVENIVEPIDLPIQPPTDGELVKVSSFSWTRVSSFIFAFNFNSIKTLFFFLFISKACIRYTITTSQCHHFTNWRMPKCNETMENSLRR